METPSQLASLLEQGCDSLQGFLLGRPVAAATFEELLVDPSGKVADEDAA